MIVAVVAIPLAAGVIALFAGRYAAFVATAFAVPAAATSLALAASVWRDGTVSQEVGGWAAPLGIVISADGFSVVMILMVAAVLPAVLVYAIPYRGREHAGWRPPEAFWALALLLWGALDALFVSRDVFNLYVSLELLTLIAVSLVVLEGETEALDGATRYLFAAFLASLLYLLAVALLYSAYGRLDLDGLAAAVAPSALTWTAASLMAASLALKAALFPLHFWLPRAHAAAPAPVSALLSSLVVTAAFYLFLRLWTGVFAGVVAMPVGQVLGALGGAAIVWGSVQAMRQQRLKVMIAYSTVAQIGYLFLVFPLVSTALEDPAGSAGWATLAWDGAVYHAVSHAVAKAAMFLAAGSIVLALGGDRIVGISGIATRLPVSTYAFGIAGMTLIGLPPSGGFVGKWLLLTAAFRSGQWWWAIVMIVGGLLTAGYVFLVLGQELSRAGVDRDVELRPVPRAMEWTAMALALLALALGIRVTEPLEFLGIGIPFGGD